MSSIIVSRNRAILIELLVRFGYCESNLQIVQDIKQYCQSIGHPHLESSHERLGKCLLAEGKIPIFVLRDEIIQSDYMVPLFARDFPREDIEKLDEPRAFVQHLLLHEIAHDLRRDFHKELSFEEVEQDCDAWAFEQLDHLTRVPADWQKAPGAER